MPFHNSLTCICGRFHIWFWYPKTPQLTMFCIQIPFLRVPYPDFKHTHTTILLPSYSHPWLWHPTPPTATIPKYIPIIAIVRICRYYSTILGCCHSICIDAQHESSLYPIAYLYIYLFIYLYYTYIHSQSFSVSIAVNPPVLHCPPIMVITHHHPLVLVKSCHLSTNLSSLLCWWLNHVQWLCLMVIFQLVLAKVLFSFLVKSLCLMAKSQ